MAQETINVGTTPNDNTGTPLRTAWGFVNSMMTEIYAKLFEAGKVLSDNNYTDAEQTKLAGIETGAQVNTVVPGDLTNKSNFVNTGAFVPATGFQLNVQERWYDNYTINTPLNIIVPSGTIRGGSANCTFVADGTNAPTFAATSSDGSPVTITIDASSDTFDNVAGHKNELFMYRNGDQIWYTWKNRS